MKRLLLCLILLTYANANETEIAPSPIDLTIIGTIKFHDGLGRIPIGLVDTLKDDISINCFPQKNFYTLTDIPQAVIETLENPNKTPGNVGIYFNLKNPYEHDFPIKIAYSLFEATKIPSKWVTLFNEHFDAVVVADKFYCKVYKESGVNIPIFEIPHGIYIEELLKKPIKSESSRPFVFGCTSTFYPRKNQDILLKAFYKEFGNNPNVKLKLHGRAINKKLFNDLQKKVTNWGASNIEIDHSVLSNEEYIKFLESLDCYVLVSKGEGFSVTPREALALGIPCILSNNTAHKSICETECVYSVDSEILEPAYYINFKEVCGNQYNCTLEDIQKGLRTVYDNYASYFLKAQIGRVWVKSYLWENLRQRFLNLIKPKKILLGNINTVTDEYLMTDSPALYKKYTRLLETKD